MKFVWDIDPVLVQIGGALEIRYYGLLFSILLLGGLLLFSWQVKRAGGSDDDAVSMVLPAVLGTIIGARLGHVIFYEPGYMVRDPLWVLKVWRGGLSSHGATLGLLTSIYIYARRHDQSCAETLDRFIFSGALGTILVRIGNFFNSEIVGRVTDQSWGVRFPRYDMLPAAEAPLRHPSQFYEVFLGLVVMGVLLWADRGLGGEKRPRGALSAIFGATYFTGRFFVEFFKEHQALPREFPLTMGQILSIPVALYGFVWLQQCLKHPTPSHWKVKTRPDPPKGKPPKSTSRKRGRKKR